MKLHPFLRSTAAVAFCGMVGLAAAQASPQIVGEATMVIGVARVFSLDGTTRAMERGAAIRVGDRVETEAGGHVHFRFVDGGRLSIRPLSRLQVESYNHSSQEPALTAIKFRLDEGVVRSITGSWGEAARDKFRLNTPVAAIGVKGTDFVVRSDAEKTNASVYTGAIVLSPLTAGCAATLGPCQSGREKLLSDDMKG
ncbi:MAG TPA: FecR family protein, partial [Ramlibacter sp.]